MREAILSVVMLTGCWESEVEEPIQVEENEIKTIDPNSEPWPELQELTSMQWSCCRDLCRGTEPRSIFKERGSPYILCQCRDGRRFRVSRIKGKKYPR